ncbi:MAG: O-antigen ligase family protein [Bacteroidetes bacterium]|nr:O-antigen ligase family protein [Bacteroidota bacterium]
MLTISRLQRNSIYLFAFSLNFETVNLFNLGIDYLASKITIVLLLSLTLINPPAIKSIGKYLIFLRPLFIFFIYLTIVSFINRAGSTISFFYFPLFLDMVIVLLLLSTVKRYPTVLLGSLVSFSIGTFLLALLFFLNIGVQATEDDRLSIFNINQNMLGLYSCFSIFIFTYVYIKKQSMSINMRCLLVGIIFMLFLLLLKTGSRGAFLSLVALIPFFLFANKNLSPFRKSLSVFGFIITGLLLWFFLLRNSLVVGRLATSLSDGDLSNRDLIWINLFDIIVNNYWFGVGVTGYERLVGNGSPHNVLIEVLCYSGIFGLLIFLIFIVNIGRNAYRNFKRDGNVLPFALFIPSLGLILTGQIFEQKVVWLILAYQIACASQNIKSRRKVAQLSSTSFSIS